MQKSHRPARLVLDSLGPEGLILQILITHTAMSVLSAGELREDDACLVVSLSLSLDFSIC